MRSFTTITDSIFLMKICPVALWEYSDIPLHHIFFLLVLFCSLCGFLNLNNRKIELTTYFEKIENTTPVGVQVCGVSKDVRKDGRWRPLVVRAENTGPEPLREPLLYGTASRRSTKQNQRFRMEVERRPTRGRDGGSGPWSGHSDTREPPERANT